jgi:predicted dehydrogenase
MVLNAIPSFRIKKKWQKWRILYDDEAIDCPVVSKKRLRIAAVGGGDIGIRNANSIQAAQAAELAAVCDIDPEVIRDLAKRYDVPAITDYNRLLARSDVDAVLLSIPHHLHTQMALQAALAKKHVLLEKPLATNSQEATKIVEACRAMGVRLTINFSFRYRPAIELARLLIKDDTLGKISGTQINLFQLKGTKFWAGGFTGRASGDWRKSKEKAGGGVLIITICHALDYLRYCTGLEVTRAFSEYGTYASPAEVEDAIAMSYQYDNGAIGSIASSTFWHADKRDEVIVWGTHGSLRIEENNVLRLWSSRPWRTLAPGKEHLLGDFPQVDYTSKWIDRFARAVENGLPHDITDKDGWINNAVIEAAYRSRDHGRALSVESFPWQEPK